MAPVLAIHHVHDVDDGDDGRYEGGPYDATHRMNVADYKERNHELE